jgi:hypothetical protein
MREYSKRFSSIILTSSGTQQKIYLYLQHSLLYCTLRGLISSEAPSLHLICSLCYNPIGIIREETDGIKNETTASPALCVGIPGGAGRNGLHNSDPHRIFYRPGKLPRRPYPYWIIVCTTRAAAWPDHGNIWRIPFI